MQLPYRSPQPSKHEGTGPDLTPDPTPVPKARYKVVGLAKAQTIPIDFQGRTYDLARLTDEDLAFLRQFPAEVPYLA